jgi:carbamoyltransferase
MRILGIKMTHDASVAMIDGNKLAFSVEIEKLDNNPRYSKLTSITQIERILREREYDSPNYIDRVVIDGWKRPTVTVEGVEYPVAPYHEFEPRSGRNPLGAWMDLRQRITLFDREFPYTSYNHMTTHIVGSMLAAPFAGEPCFTLTWDGGQQPRIHYFDPRGNDGAGSLDFLGTAGELYGTIYTIMGCYWGPYARREEALCWTPESGEAFTSGYEAPGKLMAYIAKGSVNGSIVNGLRDIHRRIAMKRLDGAWLEYSALWLMEHEFCREALSLQGMIGASDADMLASIHEFLCEELISGLKVRVPRDANLVFTGGSALNIKWNAAIRDGWPKLFVPPFPNDTGNALGAAACEWVRSKGEWAPFDWDVYRGPLCENHLNEPHGGWEVRAANPDHIAALLHEGNVVVAMIGAAELGPRALGHRSILCRATDSTTRSSLNRLKRREPWRPVAPMCMEEYAPSIFEPGSRDPYMLFEHRVNDRWKERIPTVVHFDGTARLQTVSEHDSSLLYELLDEYRKLSGIPVLCNTSANYNGSGFFPDIVSAMCWAERTDASLKYIWTGTKLWSRE